MVTISFSETVIVVARITIPKLIAELLEVEAGDVVYVTLYAKNPP